MNELVKLKESMIKSIDNIKMLAENFDPNDMKSLKIIMDISSGLMLIYQKLLGLTTRKNKSGYLYIGTDNIHGYKIGTSNNLEERESTLRCGNPSFKLLFYKPSQNQFEDEKALHKKYSEYKYCNEWFSFPHNILQEFADIGFKRYITTGGKI